MATSDVSAVQTSSLLASLHDFENKFNNNQRVKKLIKGWNRYLKVDSTDTGEIYTLTIQDLAVSKIETGCPVDEDDENLVTLQAAQEPLVRIFTGKYNPSHALIDGALAVFSGERDKVKLEAIAMIIWGM
jgi:hypothetical protein